MQTESWDDKQSGQKRSKTTMTIESFDFVSKGNQQAQPSYNQNNANTPPPSYQQPQGMNSPVQQQNIPDIDVDSIPF